MDSPNNPCTGQETWDQDEEVLLDPLAADEEILLDPPVTEEQRRDWSAPMEQERDRSAAIVGSARKRPKKGRMSRWKLLSIVLVGIVAISAVFGILNRAAGFGAVNATSQSTPLPTSTPLSKHVTPVVPVNLTSGALILLNPGIVRQGTSMGVTGSGFDPGATVDLAVKPRLSDIGQVVTFVHTDKNGLFTGTFTVPTTLSAGPFFVEARERGSDKVAQVRGMVAGGTPQLKLSTQVGKPGDMITISAHGFSPSETINVYWNAMSGQPVTTLQADGGGGIG